MHLSSLVKRPARYFFPFFGVLTLSLALGATWVEISTHDVDRPLASAYGPENNVEITKTGEVGPLVPAPDEGAARAKPIEIEAITGFSR